MFLFSMRIELIASSMLLPLPLPLPPQLSFFYTFSFRSFFFCFFDFCWYTMFVDVRICNFIFCFFFSFQGKQIRSKHWYDYVQNFLLCLLGNGMPPNMHGRKYHIFLCWFFFHFYSFHTIPYNIIYSFKWLLVNIMISTFPTLPPLSFSLGWMNVCSSNNNHHQKKCPLWIGQLL